MKRLHHEQLSTYLFLPQLLHTFVKTQHCFEMFLFIGISLPLDVWWHILPLFNLVIFNFWHFTYSVSGCGSLWVHLWNSLNVLELDVCSFPQIRDIFCHYFFTIFGKWVNATIHPALEPAFFSFNMLDISFCINKYCCTFSFLGFW